MNGPTISIGLGARALRDRDFLSLSDPYVTIARPDPSGGFIMIRTSETKKNTLNPDWNDFLFIESELNGNNKELKLRIQVFDDDGKIGPDRKDQHIGTGFFSLKELEAAALVKAFLPLSDGKRQKVAGQLLVRSFKEHNIGPGTNSEMYGAPPAFIAGGYPGGATSFPPQPHIHAGGYPVGGSYPQGGVGYHQGREVYSQGGDSDLLTNWARLNHTLQNGNQVGGGYPQGIGGYPPGGGAHPQGIGSFPRSYPQRGGVNPQEGAFPQGGAYHQGGAYPQVGAYNQGTNLYPAIGAMFPPSNPHPGPAGGFYNPNM